MRERLRRMVLGLMHRCGIYSINILRYRSNRILISNTIILNHIIMSENNNTNPILVILSVLLPIVGYVLFFTKKDNDADAAKTYLWSAVAGSIIGIMLFSL